MLPLVANYNVLVAEEEGRYLSASWRVAGPTATTASTSPARRPAANVINRARRSCWTGAHAPTTSVTPSHLKPVQQAALFPESSPLLDELKELDVTSMTPLEAINKLYEWQRRYGSR